MIKLADLKDVSKSDYMDIIISNAICFIALNTLPQINKIYDITKEYSAEVLSQISMFTTYSKFMMSNYAKLQKDIYFSEIINNMSAVRDFNNNVLMISDFNIILTSITSGLTLLKNNLEDAYSLDRDSLSIYTVTTYEESLNFLNKKYEVPDVFIYSCGKSLLVTLNAYLNDLAILNKNIFDEEESLEASLVTKYWYMLVKITDLMQKNISINTNLTAISDSSFVAQILYETYDFTDSDVKEKFLRRKYSTIKLDVLDVLANYL